MIIKLKKSEALDAHGGVGCFCPEDNATYNTMPWPLSLCCGFTSYTGIRHWEGETTSKQECKKKCCQEYSGKYYSYNGKIYEC